MAREGFGDFVRWMVTHALGKEKVTQEDMTVCTRVRSVLLCAWMIFCVFAVFRSVCERGLAPHYYV